MIQNELILLPMIQYCTGPQQCIAISSFLLWSIFSIGKNGNLYFMNMNSVYIIIIIWCRLLQAVGLSWISIVSCCMPSSHILHIPVLSIPWCYPSTLFLIFLFLVFHCVFLLAIIFVFHLFVLNAQSMPFFSVWLLLLLLLFDCYYCCVYISWS